jgi:hypothetical protein
VEKKTGEPIFPLEIGSLSRHRSCCVCKCSPLFSLAGRGGEEGAVVVDLLKQLPRCLPSRCYGVLRCKLLRAKHVTAILAAVISGRQGGPFSTSSLEALFGFYCWSSTRSFLQVVCPRSQLNGRRQESIAGVGLSSAQLSDLGGDALRSLAVGGGGTRALDCFSSLGARVFFVITRALSSNFWFLRTRDVKGPLCKLHLPHVLWSFSGVF